MGAVTYVIYVNGCLKLGAEVIIGAKNIKERWGPDVGWIIHVNIRVKKDGKSRAGKESKEPGAGGQEVHGDSTLGKGLQRITCAPADCGKVIP